MESRLNSERRALLLSILKSAFPIFITLESIAMIGVVDLEIAGRISSAAQAAVGLGDQLLYFTSTAASGLSVATCAIAARYFGAGNIKRMSSTIKSSIAIATICGIAAIIIGWVAADDFVRLLSSDAAVIQHGAKYIQLCSLGSLPYVLSIVIASIFRSIERTAESLYSSLTTMVIAIGLSYLLFEVGPWKGSLDALCVAWISAAYIGLGVSLVVLAKPAKQFAKSIVETEKRDCTVPTSIQIGNSRGQSISSIKPRRLTNAINSSRADYRNAVRLIKLLFWIGAAVVLAESSTLATDFLVYKLLSMLDGATNLQAAWTIFLKIEETFAIMPISALSLAFAATVAQMIGQGKEKQARDCLKYLVVATSIASSVLGIVLVTAPHLMATFTHADRQVLNNAKQMLFLLPVFLPLLAVRFLTFSFMEGAGQTSVPMRLALIGNVLKLVVAGLLMNALSIGSIGLVFAILLSRTIMAIGAVRAAITTGKPATTSEVKFKPVTKALVAI